MNYKRNNKPVITCGHAVTTHENSTEISSSLIIYLFDLSDMGIYKLIQSILFCASLRAGSLLGPHTQVVKLLDKPAWRLRLSLSASSSHGDYGSASLPVHHMETMAQPLCQFITWRLWLSLSASSLHRACGSASLPLHRNFAHHIMQGLRHRPALRLCACVQAID